MSPPPSPPDGGAASIVPEFLVLDFERSRHFWCALVGFEVVFERPGFAYLRQGAVEVMIAQATGSWETARLDPPLGRGLNFQMFLGSADAFARRLREAKWPLYQDLHEAWYASDGIDRGYRQVLVQDPDGYLLRFAEKLGTRPAG